jgi:AcrR family transcriptional regulator
VFHFGSKEGLLLEVVRAVEARERERLGSLPVDTSAPPVEQMWAWWQHLADPAQWPHERLFFELYAQALQGRPHALPLLDEAISAWLRPMTAVAIAFGTPPAEAEAEARLGIAVTRGLLLDLLATGDRAGVDAAMRRYQALFSALRPSAPSRGTGRPRPAAPTNDRTAQRPRT